MDDLSLIPPTAEHHLGIAALLGDLGYPATGTEAAAQLAAVQGEPNTLVLVAVAKHKVFGLITAHIFPSVHSAAPVAWITTLVVSRDSQGMGVGTMLLSEAERWAAHGGAERVSLTSGAHRAGAHAFYKKKGYENTGLRFANKL